MADPLSIAASVAGLVSLGFQVTDYLVKYYKDCRDRDADLARTTDRLEWLLRSLQVLNEIIKNRTWRADEKNIVDVIESCVSKSEEIIHELQEEVRKFKEEPAASLSKTIRISGRKATYPFRKSTLLKLAEDVDEFGSNLSVALQILQVKDYITIKDGIEEIQNILKIAQASNVAENVRDWLKAPDVSVDHNSALEKRHSQTGQWFIQSAAFRTWLERDNSFLWLHGFAGCGKSVLCSTAIQHTFHHVQSRKECAVGFFYFTFRDDSKQDASAFLRATLLQLCHQVAGVEEELVRLRESSRIGYSPVATLLEYVREAITRSQHVYLLVDALDESPNDEKRAGVLSVIQTMRQWALPNLHLLVTSRDLIDIRLSLNCVGDNAIELRNESIDEDISQYVSYQVEHDPQLCRWGRHRETIKEHLSQKSRGVFRWVDCQLGPLRMCPQSPRHLQRCLNSLPQSLDETYERMLCRLGEESAEEARRLLTLLCFSARPLSVAEVIDAIAVDVKLECFDPELKVTSADDLLRICPGLIEIYEAKATSLVDQELFAIIGCDFVRVGHFSVQEFLLSNRISRGPAADYALSHATGRSQISTACLIYLCNEDFLRSRHTPELLRQYPLAYFAACRWYEHWDLSNADMLAATCAWSLKLFTRPDGFTRWLRLANPDAYPQRVRYDCEEVNFASPVYYAAFLGLEQLLLHLLPDPLSGINSKGGKFGTALVAASSSGHHKAVQMLLNAGADADASGEYGTALQIASENGHENVVQILLDTGADIKAPGEYRTALLKASENGHEKVVQILLNTGAHVNAPGECGTALLKASENGHEKVVQILLKGGAHVNGLQESGTALLKASENGHERVVQILLDAGAKINAPGGRYGTALQIASDQNHYQVVQLLLDAGAKVNAIGLFGTALHMASEKGHENVVQILLDAGAKVDALGGLAAGTALQIASENGHEKVVQMLLDAGADVNAPGGPWGTALQTALRHAHKDVARLLLDAGAHDIDDEVAAWISGVKPWHMCLRQLE